MTGHPRYGEDALVAAIRSRAARRIERPVLNRVFLLLCNDEKGTAVTIARRIKVLVGLAFVTAFTVIPFGRLADHTGLGKLWGHEALIWSVAAVLVLYVLLIERRPFSSIGFHRLRLSDVLWAILAGVILFIGAGVIYAVVFPALHLKPNANVLKTLYTTPVWFRVLMVTRAAVTEEILYRGYGIERLRELTGSTFTAALIALAGFTYVHLSGWGAAQLIVAGYGGVVLTVLYVWRRNIWATMIAHWITDGAAFLLLPLLSP